MKAAEGAGFAAAKLPLPSGTETTLLCRECGQLSSKKTQFVYQMELPRDLRPRATCRGHGQGLFANQNRQPQAFPVPGEFAAVQPPPAMENPEESGIGRAVRGIGRFLFGPK